MSDKETTWYWKDLWTGKRYWETGGKTYEICNENGWVKLKEVQYLGETANEEV